MASYIGDKYESIVRFLVHLSSKIAGFFKENGYLNGVKCTVIVLHASYHGDCLS